MVAVREITWEEASSPDFGRETQQTAARQAFRAAVAEVADKAKRTLPECNGRVDAAVKLVLAGDVELLDDGKARVASGYSAQTTYLVADGTCECKDFEKAPSNWCKHRIATGLMKRAVGRADTLWERVQPHTQESILPAAAEKMASPTLLLAPGTTFLVPAANTPAPSIPAQYVVELHGKRFVTFAGLLALAHARGLTSLTAEWTYNDQALSLAQAVAVFPHGTFTECGDATPDNVTKKVSPHFRRVALTRAKGRCLRDALNVDMVSFEELAD